MILDQDRDWWLGVTDDTFTAVCKTSDYQYSLYFYFETTGSTADFDLARQMISSVYNAEEGDFDGCADE